ncbi:hypothetical protein DSO57_1000255, partial [Entomophthora muscae]
MGGYLTRTICRRPYQNSINGTISDTNGQVEQLNDSLVQALAKFTAERPEGWAKQLPTALLVCCTQVNRSTGNRSFELVYGTQPNIIQALMGPKLEIINKVPPCSPPQVLQVNSDKLEKEKRLLRDTFVPIYTRNKVRDKAWVMNTDKDKLQPKKVGPTIILK